MNELTPAESRDLRCIAGMMIPASAEFDVPGADDAAIFADIIGTMGRDTAHVREALGALGGAGRRCRSPIWTPARREAVVLAFRERGGAAAATLSRVILQCYYRDDRVVRSSGPGAAAAVSERPYVGARRLVAARSGAETAEDVARRPA